MQLYVIFLLFDVTLGKGDKQQKILKIELFLSIPACLPTKITQINVILLRTSNLVECPIVFILLCGLGWHGVMYGDRALP